MKIQITVKCSGLKNVITGGPLVCLFERNPESGLFEYADQTEWVRNSDSVSFEKKFIVSYFPHQHQELRFNLYSLSSPDIKNDDLIGMAKVLLDILAESPDVDLSFPFHIHHNEALSSKLKERKTRIILHCQILEHNEQDEKKETLDEVIRMMVDGNNFLFYPSLWDKSAVKFLFYKPSEKKKKKKEMRTTWIKRRGPSSGVILVRKKNQ